MKMTFVKRAAALVLCAALLATDGAALVPPAEGVSAPENVQQAAAPENTLPATPENAAPVPESSAAPTPVPATAPTPTPVPTRTPSEMPAPDAVCTPSPAAEPEAAPAPQEIPAAPQVPAAAENAALPAGGPGAAGSAAAEQAPPLPAPAAAGGELPIDINTFPDDMFRQYVLDTIDKDASKTLSEAEIAAVTEITYDQPGIKDMTGIGAFYNLQTLDISAEELMPGWAFDDNTVETLDLSQNKALTTLKCAYNPLTKLDLRGNGQLTYLDCHCDEDLGELLLGQNENLTHLDCQLDLAMETLDLRGCPALQEVLAGQMMELDTLDVSGCAALRSLDCNNCVKLQTLELDDCAALTKLRITSSALTHLDLSDCDSLADVDVCGEDGYVEDIRIPIVPQWDSAAQAWKVDITPLAGAENLGNVKEVYWARDKSNPNDNEAAEYDRTAGIATTQKDPWYFTISNYPYAPDLYYSYPTGREGFDVRVKVNCRFSDVSGDISANGWKVTLGGEGISGDEETGYTAVYTGQPIVPQVIFEPTGRVFYKPEAGIDYTLICENNTAVGTATVTIRTIGETYTGTVVKTVTILPRSISQPEEITVSAKSVTFNGQAQTPAVTVTWQGRTLTPGTDYTLAPDTFTDAGTYAFTVELKGNYSGSAGGTFTIEPRDLNSLAVTLPDKAYTGSAVRQQLAHDAGEAAQTDVFVTPTLALGDGKTLPLYLCDAEGAGDYTVTYQDTADHKVGKVTVTFEGKNNFKGTAQREFKIVQRSLAELSATLVMPDGTPVDTQDHPAAYTGAAIVPTVKMTCGGKDLVPDRDYTVKWSSNVNVTVGETYATATVTGKGNFSGTLKTAPQFRIEPQDLDTALRGNQLTITTARAVYSGAELKPAVTVTWNGKRLTLNKDYTVKGYTNNIDASQTGNAPQVTIQAKSKAEGGTGNFSGEATAGFTIEPCDIAKASIPAIKENAGFRLTYDGSEKKPVFRGDPADRGDQDATIHEEASAQAAVTIKPGKSLETLTEGVDYLPGYVNNVNAGTATVVLEGIGNYTGMVTRTFKIAPRTVTADDGSITVTVEESVAYDGKKKTPAVTVTDNALNVTLTGDDYTVSYANNVNAAPAEKLAEPGLKAPTVTVTGKGNYKGKLCTKKFEIEPRGIDHVVVTGRSVCNNGREVKPAVRVYADREEKVVVPASGYTLAYSNNVDAGAKATVTVTGKGNYTGEKAADFYIVRTIAASWVQYTSGIDFFGEGLTETNLAQKTGLKVAVPKGETLAAGTHYTLTVTPNTGSKGTVRFTVTGIEKAGYSGTVTKSVTIRALALNKAESFGEENIQITKDGEIFYTGSAIRPEVSITPAIAGSEMVKDTDYTVSYSANVNAGEKATVRIAGKGNYSGSVSKTFEIKPRDLSTATVEVANLVFTNEAAMRKARPAVSVWVTGIDGEKYKLPSGAYTSAYDQSTWQPGQVAGGTVTVTARGANTVGMSTQTDTGFIIGYDLKSAAVTGLKSSEVYGVLKSAPVTDVKQLAQVKAPTNGDPDKVTFKLGGKTFTLRELAEKLTGKGSIVITNADGKGTAKVTFSTGGRMIAVQTEDGTELPLFGELSKNISITARPLSDADKDKVHLTVGGKDIMTGGTPYTGSQIRPDAAVDMLVDGDAMEPNVDYTVSWRNNTNAGDKSLGSKAPTVVITGKGNYSGKVEVPFTINKIDLAALDTLLADKLEEWKVASAITVPDIVYTGKAVKPAVTVYGVNGKKISAGSLTYKLTYTDGKPDSAKTGDTDVQAIELGLAHVKVEGQGNYEGSVEVPFRIGYSMAKATVPALKAEYTPANGGAGIPADTQVSYTVAKGSVETLAENIDYTVSYDKNKAAGTAKVTFTALPGTDKNMIGAVTRNMTVAQRDVNSAANAGQVTLALTGEDVTPAEPGGLPAMTYTGSALRPDVTVTDAYAEGKSAVIDPVNYTVAYKNNTRLGTATVTVTFKRNYKGKLTTQFKIVRP